MKIDGIFYVNFYDKSINNEDAAMEMKRCGRFKILKVNKSLVSV